MGAGGLWDGTERVCKNESLRGKGISFNERKKKRRRSRARRIETKTHRGGGEPRRNGVINLQGRWVKSKDIGR